VLLPVRVDCWVVLDPVASRLSSLVLFPILCPRAVLVALVVLSCRRSRANKLQLLSICVTLIKFIFKQRAT